MSSKPARFVCEIRRFLFHGDDYDCVRACVHGDARVHAFTIVV